MELILLSLLIVLLCVVGVLVMIKLAKLLCGKSAAKQTKPFRWKPWMTVTLCILLILAAVCGLIFTATGSNQQLKSVNRTIDVVEEVYVDKNGYIDPVDKDELIDAVYRQVNDLDEVVYCAKNEFGVYMELDNQMGVLYQVPIYGLASSGEDLAVHAYQPHYTEFTEVSLLSPENLVKHGNHPDKAVDALEDLEITKSKAYRYYNQEVTVDTLKQMHSNSVIVWVGHGGYSPETHSTLCLTQKVNEKFRKDYAEDIAQKRIIINERTNTACVTPAFFEYWISEGALENSIIYLGACHSGEDDVLTATLIKKGAAVVYANTDAVYQSYNNQMCRTVFDALCDGATASEALLIARSEHGEKDNTWWGLASREVYVTCTGEQDLTLQKLYERAQKQTEQTHSQEPEQTEEPQQQEPEQPEEPQQQEPEWPDGQDLFDETYWRMAFGQSLGFHYKAKFHSNGTFETWGNTSKTGTYTYENGTLTITLDIFGYGTLSTVEFTGDGDGFVSKEKYPMQVGEDHYRITPDSSLAAEYEEPQSLSYTGVWLWEETLHAGKQGNYLVIDDSTLKIVSSQGDHYGPYVYEVTTEGGYTYLSVRDEWGDCMVFVFINEDMAGIYPANDTYPLDDDPSFGQTGDGILLYRQGAAITDRNTILGNYVWGAALENFLGSDSYEYMYFPNARVLYAWDPGVEYLSMYIYDDGSPEYMEAIALNTAWDLPWDAVYTGQNFVIVDNK